MGGLGAMGTGDQGWFASYLGRVVGGGRNEVKAVVKGWLWTRFYAEAFCDGFWGDFEALGREGGCGVGVEEEEMLRFVAY